MPPPRNAVKRGFLAEADKEYADRWRDKKSVEEIAAKLRRTTNSIEKYFAAKDAGEMRAPPPKVPRSRQMTLAGELQNRPEWANFKNQFTRDELEFFKYKYVELMNQFGRDDVLPTEEMQIFQLIQLDILVQRTLAEQKLIMERLAKVTAAIVEKSPHARKAALEAEASELRRANKEVAARHDSFTARQEKVLQNLKGTRDQRKKLVEDTRQSFVGLIKRLMQDEEFLAQAGFEAGTMAVAMEKEAARLAAPHRYEDGTWDQPILTPDRVLDSYDEPGSDPHEGGHDE